MPLHPKYFPQKSPCIIIQLFRIILQLSCIIIQLFDATCFIGDAEPASIMFQSIPVGHCLQFHANGVGDGDDRTSFECESRQH